MKLDLHESKFLDWDKKLKKMMPAPLYWLLQIALLPISTIFLLITIVALIIFSIGMTTYKLFESIIQFIASAFKS